MSNRILMTALMLAAGLPTAALAQQPRSQGMAPSRADSWEFSLGAGILSVHDALRDFLVSGAPESRFASEASSSRIMPTAVARVGYNFSRYAGFSASVGGAMKSGVSYLNPGASVTLTADLNQKTTPFAIVGTEFTRIDGENDRVTHSTWGAHAGAGIRHMIGAKVAIRAEGRVQLSHYNEVPMDQHTVYSPMGTLGLSYFTRGRTAPEVVIVAAPASPQPFRIDTFYSVRVDTVRDVRVETVYRDVPSAPSSSSSDQVVLRVQFRTGGAELLPGSRTVLNTVAAAIKETPDSRWQVEGHTDGVGSDAANKKLSQARAQAVVDYLVSRGVQSGALSAVGYGEERQVFSNSTAEGRAENRRVQLRRLPPPPTEPIR